MTRAKKATKAAVAAVIAASDEAAASAEAATGQKAKAEGVLARRHKALLLRATGLDYDAIAAQCGYADRSGAWKAVQRALGEMIEEPAREVRRLELHRVDQLLRAVWARAMGGDLDAWDRALRAIERRAKMLGIDKPLQIELLTQDVIDAEIAKLEAELGPISEHEEEGADG